MMGTQRLLDNAATASQSKQLLEPHTRGAVLRSIVQWIESRITYIPFCHDDLLDELRADPDYDS